jgi:hypothetical protein
MRSEASIHPVDASPATAPWCFASVVALTLLLIEETLADPRDPSFLAFGMWLVLLATGLALRLVSRSVFSLDSTPIFMSLLAMGSITPFILSAWSNLLGTTPLPLELQLLSSLRNMILLLSFLPKRNHLQPLVLVTSVFVAIFAASQGQHPWLLATIPLWGGLAAAWMASTLTAAGREQPPFPLAAVSIMVIAFALLSAWHATLPSAGGTLLAEWLESSGGTSKPSSDARSGVGDGEASTDDGEHPESDGGDGKKFVESHERSFYDALTEAYGEPYKPKDLQRAVPLPMQQIVGHQRVKSHQASREFALTRRAPKKRLPLKDRSATALLYVTGPTPIHLRLQTYSVFDGDIWHDVDPEQTPKEIGVSDGHWLQLDSIIERLSAEPVPHTIRVGAYSDRRVPLPTLTRAFRMGLVDRADFFTKPSAEVVWLSSENAKIVGGEIIETISDTLVEHQITRECFDLSPSSHLYRWLPEETSLRATLSATVQQWSHPSGDPWQNVQAIIQRLRSDFTHETQTDGAIPTSSDIAAFLTRDRKGPDYLFATTAALLLRELGCSTRLAVGYYAGPEHFDLWSRSTPIQSSQLHTWAEVLIAGRWIPVEATPGYAVLGPHRTWLGTIQTFVRNLHAFFLRHPVMMLGTAFSITVMIYSRSRLLDIACTIVCLVALRCQREGVLQWTRWLLERRLRLVGRPRPASSPLRGWLDGVFEKGMTDNATLQRFLRRFDAATYGEKTTPHPQEDAEICRAVIDQWTTHRLRAQSPAKHSLIARLRNRFQAIQPPSERVMNA